MPRLLDCFLKWRVPPSSAKMLAQADAVATHEFGDQRTPSGSTAAIVMRGLSLCRFGKPLICQFPGNEIAEAHGVRPTAVIKKHQLKPGEYLDTEEVNRQIAQICRQQGWQRVVICAHPHHLWRAGLNLKRHGITPLYPETMDIPYDQECSRAFLRTSWLFMPREILARGMYLRKGLI